jgi:ATP-dependent 26S proteasome regulatory subunit
VQANFLKRVASGFVDKYIGESARAIRDMFSKIKLKKKEFFRKIFMIF